MLSFYDEPEEWLRREPARRLSCLGGGRDQVAKPQDKPVAPASLEKTFVIRSARKQCLSAKTKHYRQLTGYFAGGCVYGSCARLNTLIVWLA